MLAEARAEKAVKPTKADQAGVLKRILNGGIKCFSNSRSHDTQARIKITLVLGDSAALYAYSLLSGTSSDFETWI